MPKPVLTPRGRQSSLRVARKLLHEVSNLGGDTDAIARRAGLDAIGGTVLDRSWKGPLSPERFAALYRECIIFLEEHDSRRHGRAPMTKSEVDMLCYCVINCRTLEEAIGRTADFCTMLGPRAAEIALSVHGEQAEFVMHMVRRQRDAAAFLSDLTGLSTYYRLFSWLIGKDIEPLAVGVGYPRVIEDAVTARLMPHPVMYDGGRNVLRFPARYLRYPVVRSYAELLEFLVDFPFELETTHSKRMPFSERVRRALGEALARQAAMPTLGMVAEQFGISPATLKRRLAEEGTGFQLLRERCRQELACDLVADPALSFGDIAQRLVFSDATTFSRAFKGWTGLSPSAYRRKTAAESDRQIGMRRIS